MKAFSGFVKKASFVLLSSVLLSAMIAPALFEQMVEAAPSNLIANPLLETADPNNANAPADWQVGNWGNNSFAASYLASGLSGDSDSVKITMESYTSGDAKWYFDPVAITAGTEYTYSDTYEASTATSLVVAYTMTDGSTQYVDVGDPAASASWQNFSVNFTAPTGAVDATVYHLINSVGTLQTSDFSLSPTSSSPSPTPSVSITAPTANATLSGTVQLSAAASDAAGIASVQFQIDGNDVGTPVSAAPYAYNWNSASVTNGTHSLSAVATDNDGQTATSTPVTVEVSNTNPVGANLIPNPLMNTPSTSSSNAPQDWTVDSWGTNTFTSSYLNSGSAGDSHSAEINMTSYTSGDAKWVFTPQTVAQDTQYQFSDYYESNVPTQVDAVFTMADGSTEYEIIGIPAAANTWTQFSSKFSVPYGAQTVTIYHFIQSVGYLTIDNASLSSYVPTGFSSPLLTLTFDDGYTTSYTNALPLLEQYNMTSTQFVITDLTGKTGYMTAAQIKSYSQAGDEIASHSVTHDDLTKETPSQLSNEMTQSQATLMSETGGPVTDFAYPYGLYNTNVVNATKAVYSGARGVESGLNSKDNFNPYDLKVEDIYTTTTTAQVADWVAQAQATNTWLVLVYHGVDANTSNAVDGDIYDVTPTQLNAQLAAIKASGITVDTMSKALANVEGQVNPASTVAFNANGGTGAMLAETANGPAPLTNNSFTRSGYTFSGWNTNAQGTGTAYANGATYAFAVSTTLYAQWKANPSYSVTFNANGGTGSMATETSNIAQALTTNSFTRSGYTFNGWNTNAQGTGTAYANGATYPFTASVTLYAQWVKTTSLNPIVNLLNLLFPIL